MYGFSDKDTEVGGKHNDVWANAVKQIFAKYKEDDVDTDTFNQATRLRNHITDVSNNILTLEKIRSAPTDKLFISTAHVGTAVVSDPNTIDAILTLAEKIEKTTLDVLKEEFAKL